MKPIVSFGAKRRTERVIRISIRRIIRVPVAIRVHNRHISRVVANRAEPKVSGSFGSLSLLVKW